MEVKEILDKAKLDVVRRLPLLAPLSAKLEIVRDDSVITLACDVRNRKIYYNKEFVEKLASEDIRYVSFVLAHELMHYALIHDLLLFKKEVDKALMNIVTDALINYILEKLEFKIYDSVVKIELLRKLSKELANKEDEEIAKEDHIYLYKLIAKELENFRNELEQLMQKMSQCRCQSNNNNMNSNNSNNNINNNNQGQGINEEEFDEKLEELIDKHFGHLDKNEKEAIKESIKEAMRRQEELEKMSESEKKKMIDEIRRDLEKGMVMQKEIMKGRGTEYGGIIEILELMLKRKRKNWRKVLRSLASEIRVLATDYDFTRNSIKSEVIKRTFNKKVFIPSVKKSDVDIKVIVGVDVSGSISDEEYKEFVNEIYNLFDELKHGIKGYIVLWETEVTKVIEIKNGWNKEIEKELKERKGYGGTVIGSFFRKAEELVKNRRKKTYIIVLTDGETENVEKGWVKDWKKVIFVLSKNGTKEMLRDVEKERNVVITQIDESF